MRMKRELPPLLLRADADAAQGTGHVMRCLALAHGWRTLGGSVRFITVRPDPSLCQRIRLSGAILIEIPEAWPKARDLSVMSALLEQLRWQGAPAPWVVLDGYHFDSGYHKTLRAAECNLLVIDDYSHLPRYDADLLLNQGVHAPLLSYDQVSGAWLLLGTRYVLLRPEFKLWSDFARQIAPVATKILLTLGGGDAGNATAKVIRALQRITDIPIEVRVLAGALNPHVNELSRMVGQSPNIELLTDVADPSASMAWADLAVAAGGTTAWELAYMQLPALLLVLADNQVPGVQDIDGFGAARALGWVKELSVAQLEAALRDLIHDSQSRTRMAARGRTLVDGLGVARVIDTMEVRSGFDPRDGFWFRPARTDDRLLAWQWAIDPAARKSSLHPELISWDRFEVWWNNNLSSPDCRIWIMQIGDLPVGQIRYERVDDETADVTLVIAPGLRGMQLGTRLLQATADLAGRELAVGWIRGVILNENEAARRSFLNAGFEAAGQTSLDGRACWQFRRLLCASSAGEFHVSIH